MTCELIEESGASPAHTKIKDLVQRFYKEHKIPEDYIVYIIFLDDDGIAEYNRHFFSKPVATDVISVNLEDNFDGEYVWGEIYVSTETARRVARKRDTGWEQELILYIAHGLFHLNGREDETDEQRREMWTCQLDFLQRCGYSPDLYGEV